MIRHARRGGAAREMKMLAPASPEVSSETSGDLSEAISPRQSLRSDRRACAAIPGRSHVQTRTPSGSHEGTEQCLYQRLHQDRPYTLTRCEPVSQ